MRLFSFFIPTLPCPGNLLPCAVDYHMSSLFVFSFIGGSMSGGEILIIMLALLMLFGSKNLPSIARSIGKSIETFRRASRDVTDEIMRADLDAPPRSPKNPDALPSQPPAPDLEIKPSKHSVDRHEHPPEQT
jgi:sec-independent protein translocase protein TatA